MRKDRDDSLTSVGKCIRLRYSLRARKISAGYELDCGLEPVCNMVVLCAGCLLVWVFCFKLIFLITAKGRKPSSSLGS